MADFTREQLLEARKTLTRQIEILRSPVSHGSAVLFPPDNRQLIDELETELAAVNSRLAIGPKPDAGSGQ